MVESASDLSARPVKRGSCALLVVILLVGAFLRFYDISRASLWMDEIWSIEISTGRGSTHDRLASGVIQTTPIDLTSLDGAPSWWHIWNSMNGVTHPPLYHVILRWWMDVFTNSPGGARSLSAVLSLAAVVAFFDVCRLLHGQRIALLAAAIMALSPLQIEFAQEARSYPMLILLALVAADALVRLEFLGNNRGRAIALALSLAGSALTHYFAVGAIAGLGVYALAKRLRSAIKPFAAAAILVCVLWGWEFIRQVHSLPAGGPAFLFSDDPQRGHIAVLHLVGMCGQWLVGQANAGALPEWVLVILSLVAFVFPLIRLRWRRDTLLWVIWVIATAGPLAGSDIFRHSTFLEFPRYTVLASPAVYALLASIDWPPRPVMRDTAGLCTLVLVAIFAAMRVYQGPQSKEDWRELAGHLDHQAGGDELLVFYGNDPWISPGMWYMGFNYYAPQSNRPWLILHGPADDQLMGQLKGRPSLWLIGRDPAEDGVELFPGWEPTDQWVTTAGAACRMVLPGHP